jgi:hypothetical protein
MREVTSAMSHDQKLVYDSLQSCGKGKHTLRKIARRAGLGGRVTSLLLMEVGLEFKMCNFRSVVNRYGSKTTLYSPVDSPAGSRV